MPELWFLVLVFQSAPRLFERGDASHPTLRVTHTVFQSAPRLFERGDISPQPTQSSTHLFQSAPRLFERGDITRAFVDLINGGFNPRPACLSGATAFFQLRIVDARVSIRAPLV